MALCVSSGKVFFGLDGGWAGSIATGRVADNCLKLWSSLLPFTTKLEHEPLAAILLNVSNQICACKFFGRLLDKYRVVLEPLFFVSSTVGRS